MSRLFPYPQAISALPTILVEGYTGGLYLEWLQRDLPSVPVVEVRDCCGARMVAPQAIALRNQGWLYVAVFDSRGQLKSRRSCDLIRPDNGRP